ncbi:MAG TPA: DUF3341 domain-containing protein, partial [Candidatus Competibacteraceae bacterium]|nr:DUF3341 domain-containing protein [Candidatus Competibacteraceae bacterium]
MTATSLYGLAAEFATSEHLLTATKHLREAGYRRLDAYTPFAMEGLTKVLRAADTRLPIIVLIGGILGGILTFALQYYGWVINYPLNVGGRPLNSWPAFLVPSIVLTILSAALTAFIAMLARNRLPRPYHPLFNTPCFDHTSQDRFFLCVEAEDTHFDKTATRQALLDC